MANITPTRTALEFGSESVVWTGLSTADTAIGVYANKTTGAVGAMQCTGTFGGATITLQGSNDGSNFYAITDPAGNDVVLTADGIIDFSTAAAYIRPASSGGTADDVTVTVILRS